MRTSVVIGTVAKPGGGKGTFPKLLKKVLAEQNLNLSIGGPRFSDALRETLELYEVLPTRENLQELAQWLDSKKPGAVTNAMRKKLEVDSHDIKIADGVRWLSDEKMIREFENGLLVYIVTTPVLRWERINQRSENAGDAGKSWEDFCKEDEAKNEIYVEDIGSRSDFTINNNGSLEEYETQVKIFYEKFLKPLYEKSPS